MGKITVVGIGPGEQSQMTGKAYKALRDADLIVGYTGYINLLGSDFQDRKMLSNGMHGEVERCKIAFDRAREGKQIALICSGDAGIYGMASLIYGLSKEYPGIEIEVIAGITAASSGASVLGAPINHDFCTISLSDLMTPWEKIEKRLMYAAYADFVIVLYNPSSHKRKDYLYRACQILLTELPKERACGYVRNIGRNGTISWTGSLNKLKDEKADMFTTCFIGNSQSFIRDGRLITPRGYSI